MKGLNRQLCKIAGAAVGLVLPALLLTAWAGHTNDPSTNNIHALGHDQMAADFLGLRTGNPDIHTDIAFQGKIAAQGNWNGFRILNIAAPGNPKPISFTRCEGNQGDVSIFGNILVRSWNSPASAGATCDGEPVAEGFEGLHVFDISNLDDPKLIATVPIFRGSHTHTLVPDPDNGRILIYNATSGGAASEIAIVEIPLADPASVAQINTVPLVGDGIEDCHDIAVFTADVNLAACAGDAEANVFDISDPANPVFLYGITEPGVGDGMVGGDVDDTVGWHSAAFSWDGDIIVLGSEPGGGVLNSCEEADPESFRTLFFYSSLDGAKLGQWVLPRTQENAPGFSNQNCTLHNFNTVPLRSGRRVVVLGNYQAGTSAVDFTDPGNPVEFAFSDPEPVPDPVIAAGVWSSYWYNNFVYETNIEEGLNIFRVSDRNTASAIRLDRLNPQTQTFRVQPKGNGNKGIK